MRKLSLIFIGFLALFFIYGCGEEERSPLEIVSETSRISVPDGLIKATLELPDGSNLKPEEMKVIAGEEEITPFATGEFFLPEPEIPQMIMALNKEDEALFFGVADPRKKEFSVGPESTAVELTFLTCMLYALPTNLYYEALDLVMDKQAVESFGEALKRQFDQNPSASLEEILPGVQSELTAAVSAVNDELMFYMNQSLAPSLEISPTERQSGCEITRNAQDPEGKIKIENYYRRYVYAIAHKPGANEILVSEFVGMGKPLSVLVQ